MTLATTPAAPGFGLYVHWPWCRSKCPYCDFNSHVRPQPDRDGVIAALRADLAIQAQGLEGRRLDAVFFGGGTPSLAPPAGLAALLEDMARLFDFAPNIEITLEANPTSVEAAALADFRAAGVNRLSMGVQALNDEDLRFLGRAHDAAEARAAIAVAARTFDRYSFDLIYARPGQTPAAWAAELREALSLASEHLSVYQLTIEEGTGFASAYARGDWALPDDDLAALLFEQTAEILSAAGLPAYEISNHARPGAECRHNLIYWRSGDWLGLGAGAHGRVTLSDGTRVALERRRAPEAWMKEVAAGTPARSLILTAEEQREEALLMGLRLTTGLRDVDAPRLVGRPRWREVLPAGRVEALIAGGFLACDDHGVRATAAGRARLNALVGHLAGS